MWIRPATSYDLTHLAAGTCFFPVRGVLARTLLVSTMEAYFQGRRELFEDLAIEGLETEWAEHPVLRFDLSTVKASNLETLEQNLDRVLRRLEETWGATKPTKGFLRA